MARQTAFLDNRKQCHFAVVVGLFYFYFYFWGLFLDTVLNPTHFKAV